MNLILGGTYGLGSEIAKALREQDKDTFVVGRSYDEAKHGAGMNVDLRQTNDVRALISRIGDENIEGFFWVAGVGYLGDFSKQQNPEEMVQVNFTGALSIAHAIWQKQLAATSPTNFVVVSSTTGFKARANEAVYAATKHAQVGFTRSLGLESERLESSVKVALFMPGGMQTPFWKGNEPANISEYLDPAKVAARICERVSAQKDYFYEEVIERGSL